MAPLCLFHATIPFTTAALYYVMVNDKSWKRYKGAMSLGSFCHGKAVLLWTNGMLSQTANYCGLLVSSYTANYY